MKARLFRFSAEADHWRGYRLAMAGSIAVTPRAHKRVVLYRHDGQSRFRADGAQL